MYMPSSIAVMMPAILRSTASASRFRSSPRAAAVFAAALNSSWNVRMNSATSSGAISLSLSPPRTRDLDPLPGDGLVVAAGALGASGGAAVAVLADDRIPAAALAADQELAQQELTPVEPD